MSAPQKSRGRVLIVDDDPFIVRSMSEFLRLEGYEASGARSHREAMQMLDRQPAEIVISDVNMPDATGFELLRTMRERHPQTVVILITGYGTIESAVEAIKMGAYDYLTKPVADDDIRLAVERGIRQQTLIRENHQLRRQLDQRFGLDSIVGRDFKMLKIFDTVEMVADSRTTVLLQGESGTGKSMLARAVHQRSDRRGGPFVEVACGSIPENLLESELFGHVRGSFTGAMHDKEGKFKAADGGTLFLDEVASASPGLQIKLLRVLQERQFEPVGSNITETVDVRLIAASNVDLADEVEAGRFREDLFYRIHVVTLQLPPLRERMSDIPLLAGRFLDRFREQTGKNVREFTPEALQCLQAHTWPGNVRELENAIERAVVLCSGSKIDVSDFPSSVASPRARAGGEPRAYRPIPLRDALEEPERDIIEAALKANGWNRQLTAQVLDINRTTLYKKMKRYGLDADPAKRRQPVGH